MRTALIALLWLAALPAAAEDCAKYEDPLAYNACLARQGPAARAVHMQAAPLVAGRRAPPAHSVVAGRRHERSEMVFSPGR
jgi:hypothetical protein